MTGELEAGLLLDLVSLSRRYGTETVMNLSARLRRQGVDDGTLELINLLKNSDLIINAVYNTSQSINETTITRRTVDQFEKTGEKEVGVCIMDIYSGRLLPNKSDITTFAKGNQINLYLNMSRNSLAMSLIYYLTWLNPHSRKQLISKINRETGSNSLQGWASIILDGKPSKTY